MTLIHDWEAPNFQLAKTTEVTRLAGPDTGATDTNVWRITRAPGPVAPFPHRHNREEILVMLKGTLVTWLEDEEVKLEAGDTLIVPPMCSHNVLEAGPDGAEYLAMFPVGNRWYHPDGTETPPLAPA